jgi:RNA polymerase sigma-70 factor (ECF subfamily)
MTRFVTTRWSLVLRARAPGADSREALETLLRTYRAPILAYVRANGHGVDAAEDLVQSFFLRFLEHGSYEVADQARGRFRTFLLTAVKRFLVDAYKEATRLKRGGGMRLESLDEAEAPVAALTDGDDPEAVFEREWARAVLRSALERLRDEAEAAGKGDWFVRLSEFVVEDTGKVDYTRAAAELGMRANTLAVAVHRLRQRLRNLIMEELAHTTSSERELEDELGIMQTRLSNPAGG